MGARGGDIAVLIDGARRGDLASLERLLAVAQPDIRRYAQRSCRAASDVDGAVQDAMWLLARRVGTLRLVASFSGWLITVVRRECLRLARRALSGHAIAETLADDLHFATCEAHDLRIDIAGAIRSLPAHYRRVLILRDVEEFTIDEIAAEELLSREAVKARLHRSRALVRDYLKEDL